MPQPASCDLSVTCVVVPRRYPKIIVDCVEDEQQWVDGNEVPVDTSAPNPNDMEFDNLYLVSLSVSIPDSPICCICA